MAQSVLMFLTLSACIIVLINLTPCEGRPKYETNGGIYPQSLHQPLELRPYSPLNYGPNPNSPSLGLGVVLPRYKNVIKGVPRVRTNPQDFSVDYGNVYYQNPKEQPEEDEPNSELYSKPSILQPANNKHLSHLTSQQEVPLYEYNPAFSPMSPEVYEKALKSPERYSNPEETLPVKADLFAEGYDSGYELQASPAFMQQEYNPAFAPVSAQEYAAFTPISAQEYNPAFAPLSAQKYRKGLKSPNLYANTIQKAKFLPQYYSEEDGYAEEGPALIDQSSKSEVNRYLDAGHSDLHLPLDKATAKLVADVETGITPIAYDLPASSHQGPLVHPSSEDDEGYVKLDLGSRLKVSPSRSYGYSYKMVPESFSIHRDH